MDAFAIIFLFLFFVGFVYGDDMLLFSLLMRCKFRLARVLLPYCGHRRHNLPSRETGGDISCFSAKARRLREREGEEQACTPTKFFEHEA